MRLWCPRPAIGSFAPTKLSAIQPWVSFKTFWPVSERYKATALTRLATQPASFSFPNKPCYIWTGISTFVLCTMLELNWSFLCDPDNICRSLYLASSQLISLHPAWWRPFYITPCACSQPSLSKNMSIINHRFLVHFVAKRYEPSQHIRIKNPTIYSKLMTLVTYA